VTERYHSGHANLGSVMRSESRDDNRHGVQ
jgi:hypothetical protein